jgi:hypothetical protein
LSFRIDRALRDDFTLEVTMRAPTPGGNTAVFLLFFGVSVIDAIWTHNWVRALLWFAFGAMFLLADIRQRGKENPH